MGEWRCDLRDDVTRRLPAAKTLRSGTTLPTMGKACRGATVLNPPWAHSCLPGSPLQLSRESRGGQGMVAKVQYGRRTVEAFSHFIIVGDNALDGDHRAPDHALPRQPQSTATLTYLGHLFNPCLP
ncbi:hypothetical protein EXN22_16920 [Pseudomonas tructae]|uniref:Uncharacterized protein n=1 Tax=Pseudomonas tructae TaxID=2518644 RepID=A0A411MKH1_9PSED|nr:hypothetical protein EXN22_16920 [Pseudomonas tructae]